MKFSGNTIVVSTSGGAILGGSLGGGIGVMIGAVAGAVAGIMSTQDDASKRNRKPPYSKRGSLESRHKESRYHEAEIMRY